MGFVETLKYSALKAPPAKSNSKQTYVSAIRKCYYCKDDHLIYYCSEFLSLSRSEKANKIHEHKLCKNYLCVGFTINLCKGKGCKKCKGKHHTLLHIDHLQTHSNFSQNSEKQVLLSTVTIQVCDSNGKIHNYRALLDNGAQ